MGEASQSSGLGPPPDRPSLPLPPAPPPLATPLARRVPAKRKIETEEPPQLEG